MFGLLLASYGYFWQSRDWNSASRLMLTYALGDRGTIAINGLERQTGDKAYFQGHFYTDKGPGYSWLALPVYWVVRTVSGLPEHPRNLDGFAYWPADYWVTLGTSGLLTAGTGALLAALAMRLGCGPRRAALVGLAYGLGTPAYVYGTLAYGHQASSAFLLGSCALIFLVEGRWWSTWRGAAAGFLAAYAAINDLSVGPVSAVLGLGLVVRVVMGRERPGMLLGFALGGAVPSLALLGYNLLAYGNPLDMGYAHHAFPRFREVHGPGNPLGLRPPRWDLLGPLLLGRYRGLLFYAPVVAMAPLGWWALARRGRAGLAATTAVACGVVFLVNLSYPEWTGGWSTGPRLLLPILPFAGLALAAALGWFGRWATVAATLLAVVGGVVVLAFQGVGGRIPDELAGRALDDPLVQVVGPLWSGEPVPAWWTGGRFARNLVSIGWPEVSDPSVLEPGWQWLQMAPLLGFQVVGIALMLWTLRRRTA